MSQNVSTMATNVDIVAKLEEVKTATESSERRQAHRDRRHMAINTVPHETIRQVLSILDGYMVSGDVYWPVMQLRDEANMYFRSLSSRYQNMKSDEKARLTNTVMYEGFRRHAVDLDAAGVAKFDFIVKIGEYIENDEVPERHLCCAILLPRGSFTVSKLRNG